MLMLPLMLMPLFHVNIEASKPGLMREVLANIA